MVLLLAPVLVNMAALMPIIPGAQEADVLGTAWYVYQGRWLFVALGLVLFFVSGRHILRRGRWWSISLASIVVLVVVALHVLSHTMMSAEALFAEPHTVQHGQLEQAGLTDDDGLIVVRNGNRLRAWPIDLVAHHHKIADSIGSTAVLVTYCTMCHTGRVYSPIINGTHERFRLVGANFYNAVFEDESTGSWWYQATGECAVGSRKGSALTDIPFETMTVSTFRTLVDSLRRDSASTVIADVFLPDTSMTSKVQWAKGYSKRFDTTGGRRSLVIGFSLGDSTYGVPFARLLRSYPKPYHVTVGTADLTFSGNNPNDVVIVQATSDSTSRRVPYTVDHYHAWRRFSPSGVFVSEQ